MVDLAPYLCPANGRRYSLRGDYGQESCQVVKEPSGYFYQLKNANAETLWFDDLYVYRGLDTSEGSDQCYAQYATDGSRYGAPWLKRHMNVGESVTRNPLVRHYAKSTGQLRSEGVHASAIRLVAQHATYAFANGQTLNDVIELQWDAGERYFYHKDYGLIGFVGIDGRRSDFHAEWLSNPPERSVLPWFNEPVPPPVLPPSPPTPTPPPSVPTLPPDDAPGWVDKDASSTGNVTNVRAQPNTSSSVVGAIAARPTPVRLYPDGTDMADGKWNPVIVKSTNKKGWVRSDVVKYADPPQSDVPIHSIFTPFVSQLDTNAAKRNNDCGIACCLMLYGSELAKDGFRLPRPLTVDACVPYTPLANNDKPLLLAALVGLCSELGLSARTKSDLTVDAIIDELDNDGAVIPLVAYHKVNPAGGRFGHYLVVYAYGEHGFWAHDPYSLGPNIYLTRQQLDEALRETVNVGAASAAYQGVVLT